MYDLALLEEEAEGLVEHGPGEVLGGHLAPAPVTPTRSGLVQHTVLLGKNISKLLKSRIIIPPHLECPVRAAELPLGGGRHPLDHVDEAGVVGAAVHLRGGLLLDALRVLQVVCNMDVRGCT